MLLADVDEALASFDWYVDAFPDDGGEARELRASATW
jgi:hypothetical protein